MGRRLSGTRIHHLIVTLPSAVRAAQMLLTSLGIFR